MFILQSPSCVLFSADKIVKSCNSRAEGEKKRPSTTLQVPISRNIVFSHQLKSYKSSVHQNQVLYPPLDFHSKWPL